MEYVCVGGCSDGFRANYSNNPPEYMRVAEYEPPRYRYDSKEVMQAKSTCSEYRLENLRANELNLFFYVSCDISIEEALQLLVSNYAIGDPTKRKYR